MLVITRNLGEAFFIGNDIKVVIVKVKGKQVQVGIEAPRSVSIVREDVRNAKTPAGGAPRQDRKGSVEG